MRNKMKNTLRVMVSIAIVSLYTMGTMAQEKRHNPYEKYLIFWGFPDNYLENQCKHTFAKIDEVLKANPPQKKENLARDMALMSLDMILHDTRYDKTDPFYGFINLRMNDMLQDLEKPVKKGVKIYKLYNDGFIMKTKTATVAVDLTPGGPKKKPFINDSLIYAIAGHCDALFITHAHGDHANLDIANAFANRGKMVIAPKGLWTGVHENIRQLLDADTTVTVPFDELGMQLTILPGHQDDMYNNIYVMNFKGGYTVAHTGDQYNEEDLAWIDKVHEKMQIDVLLLNCWVNSMQRTINGFAPKLLITGHENEMEHSIDHRESYWMTMKKMEKINGVENVLMTWGEWYWYR